MTKIYDMDGYDEQGFNYFGYSREDVEKTRRDEEARVRAIVENREKEDAKKV